MKLLIADDDPVTRCLLEDLLVSWKFEVTAVGDGASALRVLQQQDAPKLAVLDWQMPGMDGIDVCRHVRQVERLDPPYLILLTVRQDRASIIAGLDAGANDYISKPFDAGELKARINVGVQMLNLQQKLAQQVHDLREALDHVKQLQGIIPICMYCKSIRNDEQYWQRVDSYLTEHAGVMVSHGICPDCLEKQMALAREEMKLAK